MFMESPDPNPDQQETEALAHTGPASGATASLSRAPRQRQIENEVESEGEREQAGPHMEVAAQVEVPVERSTNVTQRRTRTTEPLAFDTRPYVGASFVGAGAAPSWSRGQCSTSAFPFPLSQTQAPVVGGYGGSDALVQLLMQERSERRAEEARKADKEARKGDLELRKAELEAQERRE